MDRSLEEYLSDIAVIKQTLTEHEDHLLLAPWTFYTWAIVILTATAASAILHLGYTMTAADIGLAVWLPALIIGGGCESLGWFQLFRREHKVLFTSGTIKLTLSFLGVVLSATIIAFHLVQQNVESAGIILLLLAICYFFLAIFSFKHLFIEAYSTAAVGFALIQLPLPPLQAYLAAGAVAAAVFLAAGLHCSHLARGRND